MNPMDKHDRDNRKLEEKWLAIMAEFKRDPESFTDSKKYGPAIPEFDAGGMLAMGKVPKKVKVEIKPAVDPKDKLRQWFKDRGSGPIPRPKDS